MCEKLVISEVPEARGVVGHGVDGAWKVGPERAVAMVSLVESLESEKAGGGLRRRRGTFALPIHRRGVVGARMDGALTQVECVDEDIILGDRRGKLEVGVSDGAGGVVP
jgi:hypothetical protein